MNSQTELLFSDDSAMIRVVDVDMNLNPESLDHIRIQFFSDSDITGIKIDAIETSESLGSFVATISLSQTLSSRGNRLYVLRGDNVFAKYDDHILPKPFSKLDNLEIETFTRVDSSIVPIERLGNSPIVFSDSLGNQLESFSSNTPLKIVGTLANDHNSNK